MFLFEKVIEKKNGYEIRSGGFRLPKDDFQYFFRHHIPIEKEPDLKVFFIHDFLSYHSQMLEVEEFISSKITTESFFIDLKGHGFSGGQRGIFSSYKETIKSLSSFYFSQFPENSRVIFITMGLSSLITFAFIEEFNAEFKNNLKVVAINPFFRLQLSPYAQLSKKFPLFSNFLHKIRIRPFHTEKALSQDKKYQQHYLNDSLIVDKTTLHSWFEICRLSSFVKKIKHFPRTLCLIGKNDPIIDYQKTMAFLSSQRRDNIKLKEYTGMVHDLLGDKGKEKVFADILQWLEQN